MNTLSALSMPVAEWKASRIYQKLGVPSRSAAVAAAVQRKLV